eukprot:bmy_14870T0
MGPGKPGPVSASIKTYKLGSSRTPKMFVTFPDLCSMENCDILGQYVSFHISEFYAFYTGKSFCMLSHCQYVVFLSAAICFLLPRGFYIPLPCVAHPVPQGRVYFPARDAKGCEWTCPDRAYRASCGRLLLFSLCRGNIFPREGLFL